MRSTRDSGGAAARYSDAWVLAQRPAKNAVDPRRPYASLVEPEFSRAGRLEDVATIFLTNRECPYRCLMCDLWKNTTDARVPVGAIPEQIRWALERLPPADHVKLYNSGNFFDPGAIPEEDYAAVAELVAKFETVIVESHPGMIGRRCLEFRAMVRGAMDVAMGLETVHPGVMERLNKRMTLADFREAARFLVENGMHVRTFILVRPPFLSDAEGVAWAKRSIEFAFECGVECCAVIPTRGGNGAMELLAAEGAFAPPSLDALEEVLEYGVALRRGRVFADLWDIERISGGVPDGAARAGRLERINRTQVVDGE